MAEYTKDEVATNLQLLKLCRFYQLFDPNTKKILGWNVYRFFNFIYTIIVFCVLLYATIGFFCKQDDSINMAESFRLCAAMTLLYLSVFEMIVFLYNADKIWNIFDILRLDFLKSKLCRKNIDILYKSRDRSTLLSNLYFYVTFYVILQWNLFPLLINMSIKHEYNKRFPNIVNMRFPVTIQTYNENYFLFFLLESIVMYHVMYTILTSNAFFMCFCWTINAQYNVITRTYKCIGNEDKIQNIEIVNEYTDYYTKFKSVIFDQQRLNWKLKSFYSIVWLIVLPFIACNSAFITILTFVSILEISSTEASSIFDILVVGSSALNVAIELFIYCHLFDNLNSNKELVNFGIYSCNWTNMDLKTRKLMLLTMRMNNANKLMMKASPKKIIDLNIFVNVMTTSYNILSVMLKALNTENK